MVILQLYCKIKVLLLYYIYIYIELLQCNFTVVIFIILFKNFILYFKCIHIYILLNLIIIANNCTSILLHVHIFAYLLQVPLIVDEHIRV